MSFRKIRPSFGDSTPSTSNPSQTTTESTGSDPRRVRGEREVESANASSSKRRRVPDTVTRNACRNCKKARAKCDGNKPCKRCASRAEAPECVYEVHVKHAKEELVKQIKELRAKDHLTEQILQALSTDENVTEIIERLRSGEAYESIVEWLGRSHTGEFETLSPRGSLHSTFEASDHEMSGVNSAEFRWTSVTTDTAVLDHLFQLYFTWVHPVHTLFSEGHFVDSYKRRSDNFCSEILVNSICAMACHLHSGADPDEVDFESLGVDFSDSVRANIDAEDKSITTIQAFAVMFLVDCARSKGLHAASYLKIATNNLPTVKYIEKDGFQEAWKNTVRGVRSLTVEWSQMTFQVPPIIISTPLEGHEATDVELDEANWFFYRYVNEVPLAFPSLLATTNRQKSKLIGIIYDISTLLYAAGGPQITARLVLQLYSRLSAWRKELPRSIGNIEANNVQTLPHILSLSILYSTSVLQLLRPLLDFEGFPSPLVEEVIWNHAQQGLFLLDEHYRTQYTCRYQPVLQMFGILHLVDAIAQFFPATVDGPSKDGPEVIQLGLDVLMESQAGFPAAGPLQEMLRRMANKYSAQPKSLKELARSSRNYYRQVYNINDLIDACTRPSYGQPVAEIHHRYHTTFSADWASERASFGFPHPSSGGRRSHGPSAEERGAQSLMQIHNLLNTS